MESAVELGPCHVRKPTPRNQTQETTFSCKPRYPPQYCAPFMLRNQIQATAFLVQFVLGLWLLAFDSAAKHKPCTKGGTLPVIKYKLSGLVAPEHGISTVA
eukprot:381634-Rhodomonas_salina.1